MMNVAVRAGSTLYYFKYYVGGYGDPIFWIFDNSSVFMSLGTLGIIGGVILSKPLRERFEKRILIVALTLLNSLIVALFVFIPPDEFLLMLIVNTVGAIVIGPTPAIIWAMYADTADYGEWKTGRRTTALIFSGLRFAQKMGLAVGGGLSGYLLSFFGFVANQEQVDSSLLGIRLMFCIFPAVFAVLSVLTILFYPIDRRTILVMEKDLHARRESERG